MFRIDEFSFAEFYYVNRNFCISVLFKSYKYWFTYSVYFDRWICF